MLTYGYGSGSTYDALGRMTNNGEETLTYNGDGVLVQAGSTIYTQDLAAPLSQILADGEATYLYGAQRLATIDAAGARTWALHDALGSVRLTLDDGGTPDYASGHGYSPFGVVASGATPQPFGFTGELAVGGLQYLRARWYDPSVGVFVSVDPFEGFDTLPYSLHPYQYAYSSPTAWTDPSGELAIFIHGGYGRYHPSEGAPPTEHVQADVYASKGIISGKLIKTGPGGFLGPNLATTVAPGDDSYTDQQIGINSLATEIINTYDESCGKEPIIIQGTSRGGATALLIASWVLHRRPDVKIDLIATIVPIDSQHPSRPLPINMRLPNVTKQINYLSEQGKAVEHRGRPQEEWPYFELPFWEGRVVGGHNEVLPGTSHISATQPEMAVFRKLPRLQGDGHRFPPQPFVEQQYNWYFDQFRPNPAWQQIERIITAIHNGKR